MKIGLLSTPFLRTPPDAYGGLERIVADLGEELAKLGHDITIFAADGSEVPGCNIVEFGLPLKKVEVNWVKEEELAWNRVKSQFANYDIIHGHGHLGFEYFSKSKNLSLKVCHTHHGALQMEWWANHLKFPFKLNLMAISKWMHTWYLAEGFYNVIVYNGVNPQRYPLYNSKRTNRLVFVGRLEKFKQPHVAINIAKELDMSLDIIGGSFTKDSEYLHLIKTLSEKDKRIKLHLDASHKQKIDIMKKAKCLLFPSRMNEPFGLVAVEAMMLGTPVIALNDGAIKEIVTTGGYVCPDPDIMSMMVEEVDKLIPERCRRNAMKFSSEIMAKSYLSCYEQILKGKEW